MHSAAPWCRMDIKITAGMSKHMVDPGLCRNISTWDASDGVDTQYIPIAHLSSERGCGAFANSASSTRNVGNLGCGGKYIRSVVRVHAPGICF